MSTTSNKGAEMIRNSMVSTAVAATVICGFGGAAAAQGASASPAAHASSHTYASASLVDQVADALRQNGAGNLLNQAGQFDKKAATQIYGSEFANRFGDQWNTNVKASKNVDASLLVRKSATNGSVAALSGGKYVSCVLKGVGLGGLVGTSTAIAKAISDGAWKKAAEMIIKEAAKRGLKIAVKGGAVGLAGALGGYAVWCATPWA